MSENEFIDPLYEDAVAVVLEAGQATCSNLQRVFYIGYNRAARIIEAMEDAGVIGPLGTDACRKVLVKKD